MRYGITLTGSIKLKERMSKMGKRFFTTIIASNNDYRTKEKLFLGGIVNFKEYHDMETLKDGDIIEFIGELFLTKSTYTSSGIDVGVRVLKVLGVNYEQVKEENTIEEELDIEDETQLPF